MIHVQNLTQRFGRGRRAVTALEGVGAASYIYFDKPPSELSIAESSLLAVLPESPTFRHPLNCPGRAKQARNRLLERLRWAVA